MSTTAATTSNGYQIAQLDLVNGKTTVLMSSHAFPRDVLVSKTGRYMAILMKSSGDGYELHMLDRTTKNLTRLKAPASLGVIHLLRWSSDEAGVLLSWNDDNTRMIYLCPRNGGASKRIRVWRGGIKGWRSTPFQVDAGLRNVVYTTGPSSVFVESLSGKGNPKVIAMPKQARLLHITISPDGRYAAIGCVLREGKQWLSGEYIVDIRNGGHRLLAAKSKKKFGRSIEFCDWHPDSSVFLARYVSDNDTELREYRLSDFVSQ